MPINIQEFEDKLTILTDLYRMLPKKRQRRLTIPTIFGRGYDENFISDYLAYILNPEVNGIGIAPLQALLEFAEKDLVNPNTKVKIQREHTFPGGGRIDFLIQLDEDTIVGIENKINASEGWQQTLSYEQGIAAEFPNANSYLIFLTPGGKKASSNQFRSVSYTDLYWAWRKIPVSPLPDIHKSVIWEDFLAHLEDNIIMGNKSLDLQEKTLLYIKYQELIDDLTTGVQQDAENRQNYVLGKINALFSGWDFYGNKSDLSRWFVKKSWYLSKDTYVFGQFYMKPVDLVKSDGISFVVGLYPVNDISRAFSEKILLPLRDEIIRCNQQPKMEFPFKKNGSNFIIAQIRYPFDPKNSSSLDEVFNAARKDIVPLEEILDREIKAYPTLR